MRNVILLMALGWNAAATEPKTDLPALDQWAKEKLLFITRDCGAHPAGRIFERIQSVRAEYSAKIDAIPIPSLKARTGHSEFHELGQVVFPAELPSAYPMKGAFLLCDEAHEALLNSSSEAQIKENLRGLQECFEDGYRLDLPATAKVLLKCYGELSK